MVVHAVAISVELREGNEFSAKALLKKDLR